MFFKTGCYCIGEAAAKKTSKREREIQNCNVQKGGARFPVSRKMWQRNVLFFFEQFERIFAYQFFLHVFTRRKTVCVKNVLLLNDGHLSRNTLSLVEFQISQLFVRLLPLLMKSLFRTNGKSFFTILFIGKVFS